MMIKREWRQLLEMIKFSLGKGKAPELRVETDWGKFYRICKFHKIQSMVCPGIQKLPKEQQPPEEILKKFQEAESMEIARDAVQAFSQEELLEAFEKEGISVLPLKGILMKRFYPVTSMRMMADLDILIDSEKRQSLRKIMQNAGYTIRSYNKGNHDVYYKEPCLNIEIHNKLFTPCDKKLHSYYKSVWEYALETSPYYYSFGLEDNFIYFTAHMAKHYYAGGTGIRSVIDFYLFLKKYKNSMDFNYIWSEFKKLGLCSFYEMMADLSEIWFGNASGIKQTDLIAEYIFESGVYGTKHNNILNQINKNGKYKYILNRLFPNINIMKESFPILKRHCYILPLLWIYRLFFSALTKYKNIRYEIVTLIKNK